MWPAPGLRAPSPGRRRVVGGPTWHTVTPVFDPVTVDAAPVFPPVGAAERPRPEEPEPADVVPAAPVARRRRRLAVPRFLDRGLAVALVTVLALLAGVGAGAAASTLAAEPEQQVAAPTAQQCAAAQAAWTESAARQVAMAAEKPETLRTGFVGASQALAEVTPPAPIAKDWLAVKHYLDTVAAPLEGLDPSDAAGITAAVATALAHLDTPATTAASARVTAYLKASCAS